MAFGIAKLQLSFLKILSHSNLLPFFGPVNYYEVANNESSPPEKVVAFCKNNPNFVDLINFFLAAEIAESSIIECCKLFKLEFYQVIIESPIDLIIKTRGILAHDILALETKCPYISTENILEMSIVSYLKNLLLHSGHTYYSLNDIYKKIKPIFTTLTTVQYHDTVIEMEKAGYIVRKREFASLYGIAMAESNVFKQIAFRQSKFVSGNEEFKSLDTKLDSDQILAILNTYREPVSIICGPPGSGKSKVIESIVDAAIDAGISAKKISLMATLGKAAKKLQHKDVSFSSTVHLGLSVESQSELDEIINGNIPHSLLDKELVLIDESSFLCLSMIARLLKSVPTTCRIVLIGDEDQLAPIGFGFIFRDLISSKLVPITRLKGNYRSESGIKTFADEVNAGAFNGNEPKDYLGHVHFMWTQNDGATKDALERYIPRLIVHQSLDYIHDLQVLVPTHRTYVGTQSINKLMQSCINADAKSKLRMDIGLFKHNDKVMFTKNSIKDGISNGDLAKITHIENDDDNITFSLSTESRTHYYTEAQMGLVTLAYASTIHKFNGCEIDYVAIVIPHEKISMLTKNELYSAITRARKGVFVFGSQYQFERALRHSSTNSRITMKSIDTAQIDNK
jgi:RecD/TraA family predicted helicase